MKMMGNQRSQHCRKLKSKLNLNRLNLYYDLDETDSTIPIKTINKEEKDPEFISKHFGAMYDYLNSGFLFV